METEKFKLKKRTKCNGLCPCCCKKEKQKSWLDTEFNISSLLKEDLDKY